MDSRMMSAWPACRAVSSMRCSSTQRGVQTMPARDPRDDGRSSAGAAAPRSSSAPHHLLGHAGLLVGQSAARRRSVSPFGQAETVGPVVLVPGGEDGRCHPS